MENCRTQDIQSEAADPQAPLRNLFAQYVGTENCRTQDILLKRKRPTPRLPEGLYYSGKMSDPGHSIGSGRLPGFPEDCMEWKNVGPRTDPADSWAFKQTQDLYFRTSLGRFRMTH